MSSLAELQSAFADALLAGEAAEDRLLARLAESPELGRRRLAAYRRSVLGNLGGALLATYPVAARIVGLAFFREAARRYILDHPSVSGDLNEYGGDFADFLADYAYARELPYLPDVARLEWLVQAVYYAADDAADLSALAATPAERYGDLTFTLARATARLDSPWPLAEIWRVNGEGYASEMTVDFSMGARLLIRRQAGQVQVDDLSAGEAAFHDALAAGGRLSEASAAAATDPGFDLALALQRFAAAGVLVGVGLLRNHAGEES